MMHEQTALDVTCTSIWVVIRNAMVRCRQAVNGGHISEHAFADGDTASNGQDDE
jgi:hypothetical protein